MTDKTTDITGEYRKRQIQEAIVQQETKEVRRPIEQTYFDGEEANGKRYGDVACNIQCWLLEDKAVLLAYDFDVFVKGLTDTELDDAIADYKSLIHRVIAEKYKRRLMPIEEESEA